MLKRAGKATVGGPETAAFLRQMCQAAAAARAEMAVLAVEREDVAVMALRAALVDPEVTAEMEVAGTRAERAERVGREPRSRLAGIAMTVPMERKERASR